MCRVQREHGDGLSPKWAFTEGEPKDEPEPQFEGNMTRWEKEGGKYVLGRGSNVSKGL